MASGAKSARRKRQTGMADETESKIRRSRDTAGDTAGIPVESLGSPVSGQRKFTIPVQLLGIGM
jgi:hypothetical protein